MISSPIVPAIIPTSVADLATTLLALGHVPEVHVDVVDGLFVPHRSWPYLTPDTPLSAQSVLEPYALEVDLMVQTPLEAAPDWLRVGADRLVFHVETISIESFTRFADTTAITVGIAANNDTDFSVLAQYLAVADFVQVMGIGAIGAQGQPFDERAITRIKEIQATFPRLPISVDGSVNLSTLPRLLACRLDRYIVGSAIAKSENPAESYQEFSRLARSQQG
jgi:ribulose-phosphate 3-epimerase